MVYLKLEPKRIQGVKVLVTGVACLPCLPPCQKDAPTKKTEEIVAKRSEPGKVTLEEKHDSWKSGKLCMTIYSIFDTITFFYMFHPGLVPASKKQVYSIYTDIMTYIYIYIIICIYHT